MDKHGPFADDLPWPILIFCGKLLDSQRKVFPVDDEIHLNPISLACQTHSLIHELASGNPTV